MYIYRERENRIDFFYCIHVYIYSYKYLLVCVYMCVFLNTILLLISIYRDKINMRII